MATLALNELNPTKTFFLMQIKDDVIVAQYYRHFFRWQNRKYAIKICISSCSAPVFFLSFGKCDEDLTTFLLELNQRLQSLCVHLNNEDSNALELSERKLEAFCSIIIAILLAISGLFIWGEISHIGGTSHLSEILFIPVSLLVYFQVVMLFSLFTYFFVFISILS